MRATEHITDMKLIAMSVYKPDLRDSGTLRFHTTGIGRDQSTISSKTLQALLKVSKAKILMQ